MPKRNLKKAQMGYFSLVGLIFEAWAKLDWVTLTPCSRLVVIPIGSKIPLLSFRLKLESAWLLSGN